MDHILTVKFKRTAQIALVLFFSMVVLALLIWVVIPALEKRPPEEPDPEQEVVMTDNFGMHEGQYIVSKGEVGQGQTLSHVLGSLGFSAAGIDAVARQMADVFNPRLIRAGQPYQAYFTSDSLRLPRHFMYEISALEYLRLDFSEPMKVSRVQRELTTIAKAASGVIHSSLWNALTDHGLHPELAIRMSEVLAWEVDFYRIQQGDRFKVIYREDFVGDRSVGISKIDAIYFQNYGRDIYGFRFEQDTLEGFFNQAGDNLRKVFLKAPLEFGRITSRYSHSRLHPILNRRRPHLGTDYAAPHGTPILAVGDGRVTQAAYHSGNGNYVRIRHNAVYETQYLHMSRFASGIRPGTYVRQGQVIGYVGSTGLATGPHVCFRFWKNGQQVDHLREEFPSADPLPESCFPQFNAQRDQMMQTLNYLSFNLNGR